MISETKLDSSFPEGQFLIPGYSSPYRLDRNCRWGGIMLYVREDIPSKLLLIRESRWLPILSLFGLYEPQSNHFFFLRFISI